MVEYAKKRWSTLTGIIMIIQYLFAWFDEEISKLLQLSHSRWGTTVGGHRFSGLNHKQFYSTIGRPLGIVGVNGEIHTLATYWTVNHVCYDDRLLNRVPLRKSLKEGERFATAEEIKNLQDEAQKRRMESCGMLSFS